MIRMVFLALGAACSFTVAAQSVSPTDSRPVAYPLSTLRNVTTVGPGVVSPANVQRYAFAVATNGMVVADAATGLPLPGGASLPAIVSSSVPKATVASALGRFARKTLPVLSVGSALYDLGQELGYTLDNTTGTLVVQKPIVGACSVAPCYEYQYTNSNPAYTTGYLKTLDLVMASHVSLFNSLAPTSCAGLGNGSFQRWTVGSVIGAQQYRVNRSTQACNTSNPVGAPVASTLDVTALRRTRTPDTITTEPGTVQEFEDAVAAKSGWPTSSALARAFKDSVVAGETVPLGSPTVSGPSTVPGEETVTQNADGTTTTTTVTINNSYSGPSVTTTSVTTTVVTNTSTGSPISSTTSTSKPVLPAPPPEPETQTGELLCGLVGLPPCNVAVDETGMSAPTDIKTDQAEDSFDEWDNFITNIGDVLPEFPTIAWDFALPTACGVIPLPAFEPAISEIDVCQFQPMFHQLMTVVWSLGALFGAISLFMKSSLST